jgi:uroporphyrin-III C-methyltransferase/precorrin-2 dehydrogenase/sirohydrochlorin ferrochelatase
MAAPGASGGSPQSSPLYPVFLRLAGKRVVLVGGGQVAAAKLPALLATGAEVAVIAPVVKREVVASGAAIFCRPFTPSDLDGAHYVVAAATPAVNGEVAAAAEERHLFVNAVDDTSAASAYLGGVVRRDGVTVAISTDGAAPALAGLLREAIDAFLPRDLSTWMRAARELRTQWKTSRVPMARRRPELLATLNRLYARRTTETRGQA